MFKRVSWASAASESTAWDVFIFPEQWKYMPAGRQCQRAFQQDVAGASASSRCRSAAVGGARARRGERLCRLTLYAEFVEANDHVPAGGGPSEAQLRPEMGKQED